MPRLPRPPTALRLFAVGVLLGTPACAAIWGFQDSREIVDAGADGSTTAPVEGGAPRDASATHDALGSPEASILEEAAAPEASSGLDAAADAAGACNGACVAAAPPGWDGPLALYEATGSAALAAPPTCAGAYDQLAYDGTGSPIAPDALCTCACAPPTGVTCADPPLSIYSGNGCGTTCATAGQPIHGTCTALDTGTCGGAARYAIGPSTAQGGSCAPEADAMVPAPAWNARARLCASSTPPPGLGCSGGNVCAPGPELPFQTNTVCIARSGSWSCPNAYPAQRTYFGSSTDSSGCSPCVCGSVSGASCDGGAVDLYGSATCTGSPSTTPLPQGCTKLGGVAAGVFSAPTPTGGGCVPEGGAPSGSFTPASPTTLCCTP